MNFGNFFLVSSLCNVRRDVNRCALLVFRPSWKHFRPVCFPFEAQSGSLLLLTDLLAFCEFSFGADIIIAILAQGVAAMSEAAAMGQKGA